MSTQAVETFPNIIPPDEETVARLAVISRAQQFAQSVSMVSVTSPESYTVAGETLKAIKSLRNELESACRPVIDARHKAHKEALAEFNRGDSPLAVAETNLKRALLAYDQEQERIRRAEQARLQREAEEKAREEARRQEEERRLQEAIEREEAGDTEGAKEVLEAPVVAPAVFVPPVVLPTVTPKVDGISKRQVWKFQITDASVIPREYLIPDEKKIGAMVRALREQAKIPGVKVYPEETLAGRA